MAISNPSREQILERIRAGLRVPAADAPQPPPAPAEIFEPVQAPLERFQQECKANLMECQLTADGVASAPAGLTRLVVLTPKAAAEANSPAPWRNVEMTIYVRRGLEERAVRSRHSLFLGGAHPQRSVRVVGRHLDIGRRDRPCQL